MDPNAAWEELLRLALVIEERTNDADEEDAKKALDDAELVQDAQHPQCALSRRANEQSVRQRDPVEAIGQTALSDHLDASHPHEVFDVSHVGEPDPCVCCGSLYLLVG